MKKKLKMDVIFIIINLVYASVLSGIVGIRRCIDKNRSVYAGVLSGIAGVRRCIDRNRSVYAGVCPRRHSNQI